MIPVLVPSVELERAEIAAHLQAATGEGISVRGVLSLLALDETPLPARASMPCGIGLTLALVQALGDLGLAAPLWLLTRGAVPSAARIASLARFKH